MTSKSMWTAGFALLVTFALMSTLTALRDVAYAQSPAPAADVKIDNVSFTPQTLTVHPGTTVTWVNRDDLPHTVTSTDKKFKSAALDTDQRFAFTFTAPGTYSYFCSIHPHMTGKIIVSDRETR